MRAIFNWQVFRLILNCCATGIQSQRCAGIFPTGPISAIGATCTATETNAQRANAVNLWETSNRLRRLAFRTWRAMHGVLYGGRISAFGTGKGKIGMVLIINLDRQPQRLRRTLRELSRFRTSDGA